jgi:hypothetical protein
LTTTYLSPTMQTPTQLPLPPFNLPHPPLSPPPTSSLTLMPHGTNHIPPMTPLEHPIIHASPHNRPPFALYIAEL